MNQLLEQHRAYSLHPQNLPHYSPVRPHPQSAQIKLLTLRRDTTSGQL